MPGAEFSLAKNVSLISGALNLSVRHHPHHSTAGWSDATNGGGTGCMRRGIGDRGSKDAAEGVRVAGLGGGGRGGGTGWLEMDGRQYVACSGDSSSSGCCSGGDDGGGWSSGGGGHRRSGGGGGVVVSCEGTSAIPTPEMADTPQLQDTGWLLQPLRVHLIDA